MQPPPSETSTIFQTARLARGFLETLWMQYCSCEFDLIIPLPVSRGKCRLTSEFLVRNATELGLTGWYVSGGDEGWLGNGKRETHYWLSNGQLILDLTADQFAENIPAVMLTTVDDPRYARLGPVLDTSDAARNHIEATRWWDDQWRMLGGASIDTPFTPGNLAHHMGPGAAAFAVMFAQNTGMLILRKQPESDGFPAAHSSWCGRLPDYAAGNPGGLPYAAVGQLSKADASAYCVISKLETEALRQSVGREALEEAAAFASCHAGLMEIVQFARMDEERDPCDHPGGDADEDPSAAPTP